MRNRSIGLAAILGLSAAAATLAQAPAAPPDLERYNVRWESPSRDASGSMPVGNGEVGLNVWVEEDGDLLFYVARTDTWSEISRLLKLGRIRIALSPSPFVKGGSFVQELRLRDGRIEIRAGTAGNRVALQVLVDAHHPVVHVLVEADQACAIRVALETWRDGRRVLTGDELQSTWTMQGAPAEVEVWESGDAVEAEPAGAVTWFHRNAYSVVPLSLKLQGLGEFAELVKDPLVDRTFGGRILADGFVDDGPSALKSASPGKQFHIRVVAHAAQTSTLDWRRRCCAASTPGSRAMPRARS